MGTAVRPAKTSPGSWDAFADVDVFVDEVLIELETMARDGARPMRSGPKPPLAGATLRKAVMARVGGVPGKPRRRGEPAGGAWQAFRMSGGGGSEGPRVDPPGRELRGRESEQNQYGSDDPQIVGTNGLDAQATDDPRGGDA